MRAGETGAGQVPFPPPLHLPAKIGMSTCVAFVPFSTDFIFFVSLIIYKTPCLFCFGDYSLPPVGSGLSPGMSSKCLEEPGT